MKVTNRDITYRDLFSNNWTPDGKTPDDIAIPALTTVVVTKRNERHSTVMFPYGISGNHGMGLSGGLNIKNEYITEL